MWLQHIQGDSILPMLGITHDQVKFQCFSKDYGYEKPDSRFYSKAMERSEHELLAALACQNNESNNTQHHQQYPRTLDMSNDPLLPSQILHVGNDYTKDFEGARRAGWHAVLLDRYDEADLASEWKRRGAIVLTGKSLLSSLCYLVMCFVVPRNFSIPLTDLMDLCEFLGSSHCKLG
jgi:putative hydrolase of the HAD superfamily